MPIQQRLVVVSVVLVLVICIFELVRHRKPKAVQQPGGDVGGIHPPPATVRGLAPRIVDQQDSFGDVVGAAAGLILGLLVGQPELFEGNRLAVQVRDRRLQVQVRSADHEIEEARLILAV